MGTFHENYATRLYARLGFRELESTATHVLNEAGSITVHDRDARWLIAKILARINGVGGGTGVVDRAVARLEQDGGSEALFNHIAVAPNQASRWSRWWYETGGVYSDDQPGTLRSLPVADRLALEMASHEEAERRALEGELQALESAWREAEETAAIADTLALPAGVDEALARHRNERNASGTG